MPMHIYPSRVVHRRRLATLASTSWTQEGPQDSQGQDHNSYVKGHRTKIPCRCTSTPHENSTGTKNWPHWHQYLGYSSTHKNPKIKVIMPMSKLSGPKFHAHPHLPLMGQQTQTGHTGMNTSAGCDKTYRPIVRDVAETTSDK